ncbi:TadE/TadG family type IV pilus assembly protein [Falsiroseomonas sp. E2-1-a20]|uniref:TadE/TadG family type IV pilus assembly protein n=1 Tax=Falsiroseomonas sp. E2-1-a20 TaxID=3239300 RepID=UPI003F3B28C5
MAGWNIRGPGARRGIAAVEFAVVAPVLLLAILAAHDVANLAQTSIRLERAARAGAQQAAADPADLAAIRARVIAAWPALSEADVPMPVLACECAASPVACDLPCPGGATRLLTVTATRKLVPHLLHGLTKGTGHAVLRLR